MKIIAILTCFQCDCKASIAALNAVNLMLKTDKIVSVFLNSFGVENSLNSSL